MLNWDYFSSLFPTLILQLDQNKGLQSLSLSIKAKPKGNTWNATDLCRAAVWPVHTQLGETMEDVLLHPRRASSDPPSTSLDQQLLLRACTLQVWAARESAEPFQPCRCCPSPVTRFVTANRHCTTPLYPESGHCAETGASAGRLLTRHTQKRHWQGNVTSRTTLMQSLQCLQLILT